MKAQHTPGPWTAKQDEYIYSKNSWLVEIREGGYKEFIAEVFGGTPDHIGGKRFQGTREANARLIAEAPELLRILKNLVAAIDRPKHCHATNLAFANDSKAIIARAEGVK